MIALNKNYIVDHFKLPGTIMLVMVDGKYQPHLSDHVNGVFKDQTLKISPHTRLKEPIHFLFITTQNCHNALDIVLAESSYTTIIEEYASFGDQIYANNVRVNITAQANSEMVHYKLQFEDNERVTYQAETNINQAKGSKITSHFISKGAQIAKDNLWVKFLGDAACYNIQGISLLCDHQNMAQQICVEHLKPNCTSNILSKSILDDKAVNNFVCKVIVHDNAIKTETHTINKNLLLSERAIANTAPELEVYVDDVICTHGATVGELDQEALFYLRSRGIAKSTAIKILTNAFVQEIIELFESYPRYRTTAGLVYA